MNFLYIIPARGGSKGIPKKNIKLFDGKPLIVHTIDLARRFADDKDICVSTDDEEIREVCNNAGLNVPFLRPPHLANDDSGMYEVLLHSIDYYEKRGIFYDGVVLLQPTSPFRSSRHLKEAIEIYNLDIDAVVSVKEVESNPFFKHYKEDSRGNLVKLFQENFATRQSAPVLWEINGAIYVYSIPSLKRTNPAKFDKIKKYQMSALDSIDLDSQLDWDFAEFTLKNKVHER